LIFFESCFLFSFHHQKSVSQSTIYHLIKKKVECNRRKLKADEEAQTMILASQVWLMGWLMVVDVMIDW